MTETSSFEPLLPLRLRRALSFVCCLLGGAACVFGQQPSHKEQPFVSKVWVADSGDGTYQNPVLNADYSDPDVIRVGARFYLVASSFDSVPGLPILESVDLVHWHILSHALLQQPPLDRYAMVQHGNGVWAPSLRFHNGTFFLFYPDPDIGIYMMQAKDPAGPWTPPLLIKKAKGWIDPCPLWDADGNAYLVNALAGSRAGAKSVVLVSRMKPDGTALLDSGTLVYDGHDVDPTIEGPKLYKRHGYYYIFAPAGGVPGGWQVVLRSRNIYGPYERKVVLRQGTTDINGPHQGAWVDTGTGEDWFLHFRDRGWLGRVVYLEPMQWVDDWPQMGHQVPAADGGAAIGEPFASYRKPHTLQAGIVETPADDDEFNAPTLGKQWAWQANPEPTWAFPSSALGVLRLEAVPPPAGVTSLWDTPAVLLAKAPAARFVVTTELRAQFKSAGDRAGLVLLGKSYGYVEIVRGEHGLVVREVLAENADRGGAERVVAEVPSSAETVQLRTTVDDGRVTFSWSSDGQHFQPIGESFVAQPGVWVGAKVGIFAAGQARTGEFGYADYDWIRFTPVR